MAQDDQKTDDQKASPRQAQKSLSMSELPKPFILCAVFVAGLLIATLTFNAILYFSLRTKYEHYDAVSAGIIVPQRLHKAALAAPLMKFGQAATATDIYNNIVMIKVHFATYNRCMPWQTVGATFQPGLELASSAQASGLILENGLILTSAYVATDTYLVTVTRQGEPREFEAEVVGFGRELDIGLLSVKDPAFWRDTDITVKLDTAAQILGRGNKVVVAGFPVGQDLSISKLNARVSRVEATAAGYSGRYGSFPQTVLSLYPKIGSDLTVGPVFKESDDTLIGFIGKNDKVVPIRTIAAFMAAYRKDHTGAGLGTLGLIYRPMQPLAMRMYWGMPMDNVGVQIRSIDPSSELHGQVQKADMLVAIDGEPILSNGAVYYRKSVDNLGHTNTLALPFSVLLAEKSINDTAKLSFRRAAENANNVEGQSGYKKTNDFDVVVKMKPLKPLTPRTLDEKDLDPPTYFILGGLVWTVFTEDLVAQAKHMNVLIPSATEAAALHRWRQNPDEQVIVLLRAFEHPCNKWYSAGSVRILKYFNGQPVLNMKQFVSSVGDALKKQDHLLKFTFGPLNDDDSAGGPNDPDVVLDTGICTGADKALMLQHEVNTPVSADLKDVYNTLPEQFTLMPKATDKKMPQEGQVPEKKVSPAIQEKAADLARKEGAKKGLHKPHEKSEGVAETAKNESSSGLLGLPWTNVVQIKLVSAAPDFLSPWKMKPSSGSRCSAIIVDKAKKMILTNSHCVADAMSLDVLREDVPVPVPARVVEIAHDVDLAWITTDAESFWASEDIQPVVDLAGGLPYISHNVRVVGYPQGGSSVTITQGIVSRIDAQIYPNGLIASARNTPDNLLIVQVDAAINPGNSGGPVFDANGHLVGLAFAVMRGAQNIGYVIPNVHLRNFVASVRSESQGHRWQAQSETGAAFRRIENPGIRKFLHLQHNETGVQVRTVAPGSPLAQEGIVKGDVMIKIDGMPVQGDGKVSREINGKRVTLPFDTIVTEKSHGDPTKLEFLHVNTQTGHRTLKKFDAVFSPVPPLVPRFYDAPAPLKGREHFAAEPTYFIWWGLVWGVFSNPVYHQAQSVKKEVPWSVTKNAMHRWRKDENEEVVVLLQGLGGSTCTLNYDTQVMRILQYFNGRKVNSMRDLVNYALEAELKAEPFMRITFAPLADEDMAGSEKDPDIVLHRQFCGKADAQVLRANNIPSQFSQNILRLFQENTLFQQHAQSVIRERPLQKHAAEGNSSHSLVETQSQGKAVRRARKTARQGNIRGTGQLNPDGATEPKLQLDPWDGKAMGGTDGLADVAHEDSMAMGNTDSLADVAHGDSVIVGSAEGLAEDARGDSMVMGSTDGLKGITGEAGFAKLIE